MGATNHTTNYNLSQFIGTDKPSWLNDYNGDMSAIDTAIKNAADAATLAQSTATNADSTATSAANTASALATQINTPVTGIAAVVNDHTTDITNITTTIGTTPLTTVAQTLTGAIEEVKNSVPTVTGALLYQGTFTISVSYDGVMTAKEGMEAAYTQLVSAFSALQAGEYIRIISATYASGSIGASPVRENQLSNTVPSAVVVNYYGMTASNVTLYNMVFGATSALRTCLNSFTINDQTSTVPLSGANAEIVYEKYSVI